MPPSVTYWTGVWEPHREAISKQVAALRGALAPGSPVVSFASGQPTWLGHRDGVWRLSGQGYLLKVLAAAIEPRGQVTHAFGSLDAWHFLTNLGRRPLLMTVALSGTRLAPATYERVRLFVAETARLADELGNAGIPRERIEVIRPGVDLDHFRASEAPAGRFRLLFASTPADVNEFEARGIPLLIDLARARPDIDVHLQWRQWGDLISAKARLAQLRLPSNCEVVHADVDDMRDVYASVHATAFCVARGAGKSAPNSVLEGLACGRPGIVSDTCGVAEALKSSGAGLVVTRDVKSLSAAVDQLQANYAAFSMGARAFAESHLGAEAATNRYREIYHRLAATA